MGCFLEFGLLLVVASRVDDWVVSGDDIRPSKFQNSSSFSSFHRAQN